MFHGKDEAFSANADPPARGEPKSVNSKIDQADEDGLKESVAGRCYPAELAKNFRQKEKSGVMPLICCNPANHDATAAEDGGRW